ncbi:MAG: RNA-binding protein hfq [Cyanobacteria bacterium J083]|nr:MAG: RNA-binding protein hfq [Cyanobacteria bacterium J083]
MTELDTNLPSIRQIQNYIKEQKTVEVQLTNSNLVGQILWQDPDCICLIDTNNKPTTIWRQAIVYIQPQN